MADLPPSAFTGVFHRPFAEQVAFFRAKLGKLVPTQFWDDLQKAEHDRAFMVAGAAKADLLQDLAVAVDKVISEGIGIDAFRKDFFDIAARHGWTNYTGSGTAAGRAWRTRIIYTTNAQTSYSAGRLAQLRAANFKLWVYKHSDGEMYPRPVHESWDGLVLPPDHPFWKQHYPPSGWGCRCYVLGARGDVSARAMGGDPSKQLPEGWDKVDPKTGEPRGIDKGWGYMPGDTVSDAVTETASKIRDWNYDLAKAYMEDVPTDTRDALATAYRKLPSTADDTRRYVQRVLNPATLAHIEPQRTLGLVPRSGATKLETIAGVNLDGFDYSISGTAVRAIVSNAAEAVPAPADFELLPKLLNANPTVTRAGVDSNGNKLVRLAALVEDKRLAATFAVRPQQQTLALQDYTVQP